MKTLLLALAFLPSLAFADASVPRAKQYLSAIYDVAVAGGSSVSHNLGMELPAGAIITNEWLYINTQFAASGTESLAFQCAGTNDLMAYNSIKNVSKDRVFQANIGATLFGVGGSSAVIGENANANVIALNAGYGSVPTTPCAVKAVVRGDSGYTPYTAGKATLIVEFFKL